ncbi:hypothetical protein Pan44_43560 [Caulifigura coniformis]|uniref:Magnesium transporter MgtE intracellular domain-containing protein n=1 Tax=Caulifigura coniformis TaxID=2527983 RepID=A0A517SJJ5_9PLAN|nr:hypothetical protein [Caulifigura coniformis]QDT56303.1 hypothetical protein Pan44_43560 [Caulifigura coniformis]
MKNILMMGLVAGVVFGASAGGSWFLQQKKHAAGDKTAAKDDHSSGHDAAPAAESEHHAAPAAEGHGAHGQPPAVAAAPPSASDTHAGPPPKSAAEALRPLDHALPGSIRPRPVSVEELLRYSLGLKSREAAINGKEKDLERRQAQVNIALTDIQGEQHELDGLRRQVKDQIAAVDNLLAKLAEERQAFLSEKAKAEEELKKYDTVKKDDDVAQRDNVKRMSAWFQGMEPEKAADILRGLANEGKMELAVQLLANFEEREASKVLAAIDDTTLTVELAEAFRTFKRAPRKDEGRR